tara:strand:+ start:457 stop:1158 length:702 start_codon:yes stop_codon:yes gene_type:complete
MDKIIKKTKFNIKQLAALEILAANPGIDKNILANDVGIAVRTLNIWMTKSKFINAWYDRFMVVAGKYMPSVVMAQIREAERGSTPAATLVLKHFGKYEDTLQVNHNISPFKQFLDGRNITEAELVKEDAIEIGSSFKIPENIVLPERDIKNDNPHKVKILQKKSLNKTYKRQKYLDNRNNRYHWLTRAKKVNVAPLPKGRAKISVYREWKESIIEAEDKILKVAFSSKQKSPK